MSVQGVASLVFDELEKKSKARIYQTDPEAWLWDVLDKRWYSRQREIVHSFMNNPRTAIKSANGCGKAAALDTPVATPDGWSTIGGLSVGDYVFDESGRPTMVTAKSPVWNLDSYRVSFSDGTSVIVNGEHEWNVLDLSERKRVGIRGGVEDWRVHWDYTKTLETRQMAEMGTLTGGGQLRWRIPTAMPLEMPEAELPIDPYVLGAWLGDGTTSAANITCHPDDREILDRISETEHLRPLRGTKYGWTMANGLGSRTDPARLGNRMRWLGLIGRKHIPAIYLRASRAQRVELLRGLMDTDGTIAPNGQVQIDLCDKTLAYDLIELINSLGWMARMNASDAKLYGRVTSTRYRITFRSNVNPFYLKRKAARWKKPGAQASRHTARVITSIELLDEQIPTQCIEVDSPRHLFLLGKQMVPTHNSAVMADLITWWVSVFPPEDTLAIVSAPTISQVEKVIFAYLKANFASAKTLGRPLVGEISEQLTWKFENPATGKKDFLAFGKKPSDGSDIVSSFQGTRKLRTGVFLDEAGGVPTDLYTAAEAVATGEYSKILAIGNPDRRGTEFHRMFTDPRTMAEWNLQTISSFDLPTFTGERTYSNPEREEKFLKSLTSREWVEHKRRAWGEGDARWLSKVLGEFPGEADNTFFPQHIIDRGVDTTIEEDAAILPVLGVDIARWGDDESVIYVNRGGHVRVHPEGVWGKADTVDSARRIHRIATDVAAERVQIDASGIGGAVYDMLVKLEEFGNRTYDVVAIDGGSRSPDPARWSNIRAYNHDYLRQKMSDGSIDVDFDDKKLLDEMIGITYKFNQRGAIQITPKDEMRSALGGSPDRLDAVMYAVVDYNDFIDSGPKSGDVITMDVDDFEMVYEDVRGLPV